jgi:hypothetical protein
VRNGGVRLLAAAAAVTSVLAASACVAMPAERTGAADPWKPPSPEKFLTKFESTSNQAADARDLRLIQSVESGPLLKSTLAAYRIARKTDPDGAQKAEPVQREGTKSYMPKFDNYPLWFIDQATVSSGTVYGLTLRVSAGDDWKKLVEVYADSDAAIPEIAEPATPVTTADKDKFARDATAIPRAYAGWAQSGLKGLQAGAFAPHPGTTELLTKLDNQAKTAQQQKSSYKRTVAPGVARMLATKDGGALVLFSMEEKVEESPAAGKKLPLDEDLQAYTGAKDASGFLKASYVWQVAAHVPAKGQNDDNVTILGVSRTLGTAEVG